MYMCVCTVFFISCTVYVRTHLQCIASVYFLPAKMEAQYLVLFSRLQIQKSVPEGEESSQVKDLTEKLAILQHKRQEDKARIKELERYKAQCQQVREGLPSTSFLWLSV